MFITRHVLGQRLLVEPVLQDRFDVRVRRAPAMSARSQAAVPQRALDAMVERHEVLRTRYEARPEIEPSC